MANVTPNPRAAATRVAVLSIIAAFAVITIGHTAWVHITEFLPAEREWELAHSKGDQAAMWAAFDKEMAASDKSLDILWFIR